MSSQLKVTLHVANTSRLSAGESKPFIRNVFTLNSCSHIVGSQVLSYKTELELLEAWRDFVEQVDPDVVIGYNIANFDLPYLLDRAGAIKSKKFAFLGRCKGIDIPQSLGSYH